MADANDGSVQRDQDLLLYIKGKQDNFEYAFTTVCFASLALSFQYSPRMGHYTPWLLVTSWMLYLLAALLGGYRLMVSPQFDKINRAINILKRFISQRTTELKRPAFKTVVESGRALDPDTGKPLTIEQLSQGIAEENEKLRMAEKTLSDLDNKTDCAFKLQLALIRQYPGPRESPLPFGERARVRGRPHKTCHSE